MKESKKHKTDDENLEVKVLDMYDRGISTGAIAKKLDISKELVNKIIIKSIS